MYAVDGKYGDKAFSDFGLVICKVDSSAGTEILSMGSELVYNLVKTPNSNKWNLYGTQYANYLTITFQVAKMDTSKTKLQAMGTDEYSSFMRWVNRKNVIEKFKPIQSGYNNIYFTGSFNAQPIELCGEIYGAELTFTSDSPFGYLEIPQFSFTTTQNNQIIKINDQSDEIGFLYPDTMTIKCKANGNLTIHNSIENISTIINNVTNGEIITLDGQNQIITSSTSHNDTIYDDFNAEFFRIANTYENRINTLTISLPCEISFKYSPVRKVGV